MFGYDSTINIGMFLEGIIFWGIIFVIAWNETSNKRNRR
jgi:hypothetical protein